MRHALEDSISPSEAPATIGRHWALDIVHEELGRPDITASVEFARRPLALPPQRLRCEALAIHRDYGFALPTLPVIALEEACAEKLARWRRTALQRDCYDLAWYAEQILDESLIRRLWVLKVWGDVVQDGRGSKPLDPAVITTRRLPKDFQPDSMGKLTHPVELGRWEQAIRTRFVFLTELDADEQHWARCDPATLTQYKARLRHSKTLNAERLMRLPPHL